MLNMVSSCREWYKPLFSWQSLRDKYSMVTHWNSSSVNVCAFVWLIILVFFLLWEFISGYFEQKKVICSRKNSLHIFRCANTYRWVQVKKKTQLKKAWSFMYSMYNISCWYVTCTSFPKSSQCLDSETAFQEGSSSWRDEQGMVYLWSTHRDTYTGIFISTEPQCCPLCNTIPLR